VKDGKRNVMAAGPTLNPAGGSGRFRVKVPAALVPALAMLPLRPTPFSPHLLEDGPDVWADTIEQIEA
jgi:hypothetical protein